MTRTMYENEDDRNNEQAIMERLAAAWDIEYHKLPMSYRMDFAVTKADSIVGFAEVKMRRMNWGQYPTIMLSMSKVHAACQYHQSLKLPTVFVVGTMDGGCHYTHLHDVPGNAKLVYGGRTMQTRDSADVEPCYMIPINRFVSI